VSAQAQPVSTASAPSSSSTAPAPREPNGDSALRVGSALDLNVKLARLADHLQSAAGILRELSELSLAVPTERALMCPVETKPLLTVRDVAQRLALAERTVRRLRSRGEIPQGLELGGVIRWRSEEIETWLASGGRP
jgi:excisionase family DNA binding protein